MTVDTAAYWGSFAIPLILLGLGACIDKVIEGGPFRRHHFFMGIDLTIYFVAAVLINFLDIARQQPMEPMRIIFTALFLASGMVMLVVQMGIHQIWRPKEKNGRMQLIMLCYFSNGLSILLLYGFVKLKARGLI